MIQSGVNVQKVEPRQQMNQPIQTYSGQDIKFQALLHDKISQKAAENRPLQFSRHAAQRVEQRGIQLTQGLMDSLSHAVEKARTKGAKDVVIIGNDNAFIVNVPNNVVVTTMTGNEMKENIFTNIDSAVIL